MWNHTVEMPFSFCLKICKNNIISCLLIYDVYLSTVYPYTFTCIIYIGNYHKVCKISSDFKHGFQIQPGVQNLCLCVMWVPMFPQSLPQIFYLPISKIGVNSRFWNSRSSRWQNQLISSWQVTEFSLGLNVLDFQMRKLSSIIYNLNACLSWQSPSPFMEKVRTRRSNLLSISW